MPSTISKKRSGPGSAAAARMNSRSAGAWERRASCRVDNGPDTVAFEGKNVTLPVIGPIPTHRKLGLTGSIRTVTTEREGSHWFACVTVKTEDPEISPGTGIIGVDVGARKIAACSDGTTYPVPKALRHQWGKIHRYREQLAQQTKGQLPAPPRAAQA